MPDNKDPNPRTLSARPLFVVLAALLLGVGALGGIVLLADGGDQTDLEASVGHHMDPQHVAPMARSGQLEVAVGDYWFRPSARRVRAGAYRFVARNYGVVQHDVMLERTPIEFSAPGTPVDEAAPFGVDGLQPGATLTTKVMLTPGRWELFCSVAGHYQAGQHEVLEVYGRMPHMQSTRQAPMDMGAPAMRKSTDG